MVKLNIFAKEIKKDNKSFVVYSTRDREGKFYKVCTAKDCTQSLPKKSCVVECENNELSIKYDSVIRDKEGNAITKENGETLKQNLIFLYNFKVVGDIERHTYTDDELPF